MSRQHRFPLRTRGFPKRTVNFTEGEIYLLAKLVDICNSVMDSLKTQLLRSNYHLNIFY